MERQCSAEPEAEEEKEAEWWKKKLWKFGSKGEEKEGDCKKTQAQRLFEFELWTDKQALKDLEYSQRRTEKKQRKQERQKAARNRCWKKLYLPALLGMVGGTALTLGATLRSVGGDSILWEAREVLVVVGPAVLCLGFLALMLAAGCTFQHDQRTEPWNNKDPFLEFLLQRSRGVETPSHSRSPLPLRSTSMDFADLPIPEDLDPDKNYVTSSPGWTVVDRNEITSSSVFLNASNSFASTASWVKSVSESHSPKHSLTRQNSDSNLVAGRCERHAAVRRFFHGECSETRVAVASHSDLHVACTRSLTSSGYQSASDSTTGPGEYHVSGERGKAADVVLSSVPLRHASRSVSSDTAPKSPARTLTLPRLRPDSSGHQKRRRLTMDSAARPGHAEPRQSRGRAYTAAPSSPQNLKTSAQDGWKEALHCTNSEVNSTSAVRFSSHRKTPDLPTAAPLHASEQNSGVVGEDENVPGFLKHPAVLEPVVFTIGGVKVTDV